MNLTNEFQFEDGFKVTIGEKIRFRDNWNGVVVDGEVIGFTHKARIRVKLGDGSETKVSGGNILRPGETR